MELTAARRRVLEQLPEDGSFGTPLSSAHNGTLAALIRCGLIEWSGGQFTHIWQLNRGQFRRLTEIVFDQDRP